MASEAELINACKDGLRISRSNNAFDDLLKQKIATVKGHMKIGGVSDAQMDSDLGTGTIVLGVLDIFGVIAGEMKFSTVFQSFVIQLALKSNAEEGA